MNNRTVVSRKLYSKSRQLFSDTIRAWNIFGDGSQTRLINGTVIAVHERNSENIREKRIVEARYIFRAQSPSINLYTKVFILTLYHLKSRWVYGAGTGNFIVNVDGNGYNASASTVV